MNTSHGWIKLYRCLLDDAVCQKSAYFHLWVTLLLMAAHTEHDFIFNNEIHTLKPGQLITGRKKLSTLTGIHASTVQRGLQFLENAQMIDQQTNTKFSVITIKNWEYYQSTQTGDQPEISKRTSTDQPVSTYKKDKNEKNEKTHRRDDFYFSSEQKEMQRIRQANEEAIAKWLAEPD